MMPAGVLYYFFKSGILGTDGPVSFQEAEQLHFKKMKADGLLVADMHALQLAERDLTTGDSTLLPVALLKSAEPYLDDPDGFNQLENPMEHFRKSSQGVVTKEQLELLMEHTRHMILSLGEEIHSGNIAVRPCRIRQFTGCQYCSYQAICQIQTVDFEKNVEELPVLKRDEIWNRLAQHRFSYRNDSNDVSNQKGGV